MFLWYGMGFTLYLTKFPERFFPNRYVLIRCHMCGKLALCCLLIVILCRIVHVVMLVVILGAFAITLFDTRNLTLR
jgi:hypothetical protein